MRSLLLYMMTPSPNVKTFCPIDHTLYGSWHNRDSSFTGGWGCPYGPPMATCYTHIILYNIVCSVSAS